MPGWIYSSIPILSAVRTKPKKSTDCLNKSFVSVVYDYETDVSKMVFAYFLAFEDCGL